MTVSALILTLNEERNIAECLDALSWCDDVVVLDSHSADATASIAIQHGARVFRREFDNWAAHQNWALSNIDFRHPWVLYLDADERCAPDLRDEIRAIALENSDESAFRVRRKDMFMGRWLKRAQLYPTWLIRLFRPERVSYERLVNPVAIVDGNVGTLSSHIIHFPFSHGIAHWIARHNKYSDLEALELIRVRESVQMDWFDIFSLSPENRRRALKQLFFRLPARPVIKFIHYYLIRRGFLDGRAGLTYSALQSFYEFMIDCKYRELMQKKRSGLPL